MRIFWKIIFFIPGAAIGFILSTAISQASQEAGIVIAVLGLAVGGSITTSLGTMLFLKSEIEAKKSGGFVKFIIRFLIIAIIIIAGILALGKLGILR